MRGGARIYRQAYRSGHNGTDSKSVELERVPWVRIPPPAPKAAPCGVLLFIFVADFARATRWDSNSPCPALCVPPGCNSPADCCKGAGESHRLRQVSLLNFTLGSDFFIAALQNFDAFLIGISPLFSSSDFRVRYKSYQQSRQIAIHRTTQDSSNRLYISLISLQSIRSPSL